MTATGTVYALIDPRDGKPRYVGQTVKTLPQRLKGHLTRPAWRVEEWITGLRTAGLSPQIAALRESVPADELLAAEHEEITRLLAAGSALLNEHRTARGRELNHQRVAAERVAAWAEMARVAAVTLDGPMPPGELTLAGVPDAHVRGWSGDPFGDWMESNRRIALHACYTEEEDTSRFIALTVWYMVAVYPWRNLAELGKLPLDDASFIAWAGREAKVREALAFLAAGGDGMLAKLSVGWHDPRRVKAPGRLLGAVVAAYADTVPDAIHSDLAETLEEVADSHMLTRPMADLLMRLNPRALDAVFGKDIAAELDRDLSLAPGTSGQVLRALVDRMGPGYSVGKAVQRVATRSAQTLPVRALPDYQGWSGPIIPAARSISGCLVRAGLAEPDDMTPGEYLSYVRGLWTAQPDNLSAVA